MKHGEFDFFQAWMKRKILEKKLDIRMNILACCALTKIKIHMKRKKFAKFVEYIP